MEVAIVGNGPSYQEYLNQINKSNFDVIVGCNFPDDRILDKVDYSAFCDARALRMMRIGGTHHDKLGKFKIIAGPRAVKNLEDVKERPGGSKTCRQYFEENGHLDYQLQIPTGFIEVFEEANDQKFFTSGHLACVFACEIIKDAEITIFGCDVMFNGNHRDSLSNIRVHEGNSFDNGRESTPAVANKWKYNWRIMHELYGNKILFRGPDNAVLNMRSGA